MDDSTRREFVFGTLAAPVVRRRDWKPAYLQLSANELAQRAKDLGAIYESCRLCPRACGVNRKKRERGVCRAAARAKVAAAHPHFGEERVLVGRGGSGTIFFSHCNLLCVFCQNYNISHFGEGEYISDSQLAEMMIALQRQGCENINLVTPTHVIPSIVSALQEAVQRGLRLPLVYNCSGWEPPEIVRMLDGIVDIYLPDFKYMDGSVAERLSNGAASYPEVTAAAIREMNRQVGELTVDEKGVAVRGLIIRHLVLPENLAGTDAFVRWVAAETGPATYVNIMGQYRPEYKAREMAALRRRITRTEYEQALTWAREAGLTRLDRD
jgi:putative pyruvate formate lyase activating enzyme